MKISIRALIVGVAVSLFAAPAFSDSNVINLSDENVQVFWRANGCAGIKGRCTTKYYDYVCKHTTLGPGEKADYSFKDGTTVRQVTALNCLGSGKENTDTANTGNKGGKKRCAITLNDDRHPKVKCGYSQEEYQALKAD